MFPKKSKKILFFSPYGLFTPHIMREMVLIQRLIRKNYEITNVTCDSIFNICDYKTECEKCFNITKGHVTDASFTVKWLSKYMNNSDQEKARQWLNELKPEEYTEAKFDELKLGDWVRSSVHFKLKISKFNFTNPVILKTYQDFLLSGYSFACAAKRLLDESDYQQIIMTNGRFFSHRILLEMAKLRSIPVVTQEYGHYHQTSQLQYGLLSNSYNNLSEKWYELNRRPLNLQALLHVHQIILDKRYKRRSPYGFFTPLPKKLKHKLSGQKKMVLCALSSEYEYNASPDFPHIIGTQVDWMRLLIPEISKYPDHHFVIKLHPNSEESIVNDMKELFSQVNMGNCEVLWPTTQQSTYDLIDQADYIMVFWSTVGMEAACSGKKVFCITHCAYYGAPFLKSLSSAKNHADELKDFLLDLTPLKNIREEAYRFCYRYFIEQSIPFTPTSNPKGAVTIYNQPIEFYKNSKDLPYDPYLDHLVDSIEKKEFPDTTKINGEYRDVSDIQEKFFFKCTSLIKDFGDISHTKKKILILRDKNTNSNQHCFENQIRISLFENSNAWDWFAFFLLIDGHQVYIIDPKNKPLLEQWAHEYGLFSGSHYLKGLLNSPVLFKFVSEILFRSPFLTKIGRKLLFLLGKTQKNASSSFLLQQFTAWFEPNYTFADHARTCALFDPFFQSYSFTNKNLDHLMNHPQFETSFKNIFTALRSEIR